MKCPVRGEGGPCGRETGAMLMCLGHWISVPVPERRTLLAEAKLVAVHDHRPDRFRSLMAEACEVAAKDADSSVMLRLGKSATARAKRATMNQTSQGG